MTEAAAVPAEDAVPPVEAAEADQVCANCDTRLQGDFCHACGQKAHLQSKLRHLLREFFESIATFDGRVFRTLPLLAFRPGELSRRWRAGQRVRFVAPLHFFLFAVFLVFLVPTFSGRHLIGAPDPDQVTTGAAPGFKFSVDAGTDPEEVRRRKQARVEEARAEAAAAAAAQGLDPAEVSEAEAWLLRNIERMKTEFAKGEDFTERTENLASKLAFVLVPISMLILWLLMLFKRGYSFYDHAVVALYGTGFLALLVAVALALPGRAAAWAVWVIVFAAPVHAVVHLRGAYALSWPGAVIRGFFLGLFSAVAYGVFLVTVILLGVFT